MRGIDLCFLFRRANQGVYYIYGIPTTHQADADTRASGEHIGLPNNRKPRTHLDKATHHFALHDSQADTLVIVLEYNQW
jgi:hypothetical protein